MATSLRSIPPLKKNCCKTQPACQILHLQDFVRLVLYYIQFSSVPTRLVGLLNWAEISSRTNRKHNYARRPKWQPGPTLEPPLLPCCGSAQCRTPNTPPLKNAGEGREATHAQKFPRFSPLAAHQHHPERLAVGAEEVRSRRCITNPSAPPFQLGFLCSR